MANVGGPIKERLLQLFRDGCYFTEKNYLRYSFVWARFSHRRPVAKFGSIGFVRAKVLSPSYICELPFNFMIGRFLADLENPRFESFNWILEVASIDNLDRPPFMLGV